MAGTFRRHHDDIQIGTRHHLVIVDVEAVGEGQRGAFLDVRLDILVIHSRDVLVRQQHHHDIGSLDRLGNFLNLDPGLLDLAPGSAALTQANRDLDAGISQILSVGMALGAVTNDGDLLALDQREIGVLVIINFHEILFVYR